MSSEKVFSALILVLILALAGAVYSRGFTDFSLTKGSVAKSLPSSPEALEAAKTKALDFINKEMVAPGTEVSIKEIIEEEGLYKLKVAVSGRDVDAYMTKGLTLFFPNPVAMTEVAGAATEPTQPTTPQELPKSEKPSVQLFTMSYCPYGNQAEATMKPVVDLLGDAVTVEPHYVIYENYQGGGPTYCIDPNSKFCSMHGAAELNQDLRELCIFNNQRAKFWAYLEKVNADCTVSNIETCWKTAADAVSVNTAQVESCFKTNSLTYAQAEKDLGAKYNVTGSPTLVINGVTYEGDRTADAYKTAICSAFNTPPSACSTVLSSTTSATSSGGCE